MSASSHDDTEDIEVNKKKRRNLFDIFYNMNGGKEITDDDRKAPRNFLFFFKLTSRNLLRLFYANILFLLANFPIILIALFPARVFHTPVFSPSSPLALPFIGVTEFGITSPQLSALLGVFGNVSHVYLPTTLSWIFLIVGALLLLFTFGPVSIGITYNLRNIVRGEPVFFLRDFWYSLKKNIKQGIIVGIIDLLLCFMLTYDLFFFYGRLGSSFMNGIMFWATVFMILIYFTMRFYIYLLTLTFDLKIIHIFKNALIFAFLGFKRNFLAILGIILVIFINFYVMVIYLPIGIILPLIISVGLCMFMATYAAWPKIKEIMIDAYEQESENDDFTDNADV